MSRASKRKIDSDLAARIPKFKSEKEEAKFWDANDDLVGEILKRHGKVVGPLNVIKSEAPTQAISIRVPVEDIAKAKEIAKKKGKGYQTVLKEVIHEGLRTRVTGA